MHHAIGGEGNDFLGTLPWRGDPSKDSISGGEGNDAINVLNKAPAQVADMITCGEGTDSILVDREDVAAADCEKVFVGNGSVDAWFESIPESFWEELPPFF